MRDIVRARWLTFTEKLEGGVPNLYNDMRRTPEHPHGITTIAYGNAVFTPSEAAALPLVHADRTYATPAEKIAAWHTVHDNDRAGVLGWKYAATLSPLRLTHDGMTALALAKLDSNDRILAARIPGWEDLGACCQMAVHSLSWACGANFHFPKLLAAIADRDFDRCAVEIHANEYTPEGTHNAGLVPRNIANKILIRNAQRVESFHLDPDLLDWTHDLATADEETVPVILNPASEPTVCVGRAVVEPIVHVDPSEYLQNRDDQDDNT